MRVSTGLRFSGVRHVLDPVGCTTEEVGEAREETRANVESDFDNDPLPSGYSSLRRLLEDELGVDVTIRLEGMGRRAGRTCLVEGGGDEDGECSRTPMPSQSETHPPSDVGRKEPLDGVDTCRWEEDGLWMTVRGGSFPNNSVELICVDCCE